MFDIMTMGELLVDLTQTGVQNGIAQYAANPGGAPANVAVAAQRLGASTAFVGKVGQDAFGLGLKKTLEDNGVGCGGLYVTGEAPTTLAVVSVAADGDRSFTFYRDGSADTLLTSEETVAAMEAGMRIFHLGSLSLTAEPARSATFAAIQKARDLGALVSYDPNYRASLWADEETAVHWMKQPLPLADVVKLSEEELPLLTGLEDLAAGSQALTDGGAKLVLVTLGSDGVFYRMGEATGHIPAVKVQVADTNGAGDTFLGAVLSRLCKRPQGLLAELTADELEEILRFANRAAGKTCSRSGAIPAMPTLEEVEA